MTSFTDLPLPAELQQGLATARFTTPTPVQAASIPPAMRGQDVLATAQTGTGKTLAFLIPIINRFLNQPSRDLEALVLVPTRELAMQVHAQHETLRGKLPPAALVIGGVPERQQIHALRSGARLAVATPGRLEDFLSRKQVTLRKVQMLVLDEADRMLDMGFLPSIRRIVSVLPEGRQTLCFSATLEASVAALVHDYMRKPVRVELGSTLKPVESVHLQAFEVAAMEKGDTLRNLLHAEPGRTLVFVRTKRGADRLAKSLSQDGFAAAVIHGDRSQAQRTGALNGFEGGQYRVLVATDVASRGLHIEDVAHVINYDLPKIPEDFIHRVGRTGRAGARGRASSLVSGAESIELRGIERALRLRIERKCLTRDAGERRCRNTLISRTLTPMPGERFA